MAFIADFVKHIRSSENGRAKAFCVGEFWKGTFDPQAVADGETLWTVWSRISKAWELNSHALILHFRVGPSAHRNKANCVAKFKVCRIVTDAG